MWSQLHLLKFDVWIQVFTAQSRINIITIIITITRNPTSFQATLVNWTSTPNIKLLMDSSWTWGLSGAMLLIGPFKATGATWYKAEARFYIRNGKQLMSNQKTKNQYEMKATEETVSWRSMSDCAPETFWTASWSCLALISRPGNNQAPKESRLSW